jgi:O-antigen/teichoic acid export membrane protein
MANKPSLHTLMLALLVLINLVANLLLIPRYGVLGAALATSITGVATALFVRRFARKRVGVMI